MPKKDPLAFKDTRIGPLSPRAKAPKVEGKHFLPIVRFDDIPTRITNSSSTGVLTARDLPKPFIRPGADHSHLKSFGVRC